MAAGLTDNTKGAVNAHTGGLVVRLRDALADAKRYKVWFDETNDAALTALGYSAADVTLLRASVTDLAKLADIAAGQATQTPASDFFFNARHLTGLS